MRERPVTQGQQQISVTASMPRKAQGRVGWKDCIEQAASRGTMAFSEGTHPAQGILQGWTQGINLLVSFSSFPLTPTRTAHWLNPTRSQKASKPGGNTSEISLTRHRPRQRNDGLWISRHAKKG